jgi:hypothetical protein
MRPWSVRKSTLHRGRQSSIARREDLGRDMQWWAELGCCPIEHLTGEHDPSRHGMAAMPRAIENDDVQSPHPSLTGDLTL